MLTASLAVLCGLLVLVLLIQRPTAWPALLALVVAVGRCWCCSATSCAVGVPLGVRRQL